MQIDHGIGRTQQQGVRVIGGKLPQCPLFDAYGGSYSPRRPQGDVLSWTKAAVMSRTNDAELPNKHADTECNQQLGRFCIDFSLSKRRWSQ